MSHSDEIAHYVFGEGGDGYADLEQNGKADESCWKSIRSFARSISWKSEKLDHPDASAVALVPVDGYAWVCKISDAGKDRYGRSLALRVEATLFRSNAPELTEQIALYADPKDVPLKDLKQPLFLQNGALISKSEMDEVPGSKQGRRTGGDPVGASAPRNREVRKPSAQRGSGSHAGASPYTPPPRKPKRRATVFVFIVLVAVMVGEGAAILWLRDKADDLRAELQELKIELREEKKRIENLDANLAEKDGELVDRNRTIERLQKRVLNLQAQRDNAREDADEELRNANKELAAKLSEKEEQITEIVPLVEQVLQKLKEVGDMATPDEVKDRSPEGREAPTSNPQTKGRSRRLNR